MKYERYMRKEKEPSHQKKESCSFSTVTVELKTPISFLLLVESHVSVFYAARWLTFPLVAFVSVTSNPRLKTPNNGLIKPRQK